jgi:hypothetical protein
VLYKVRGGRQVFHGGQSVASEAGNLLHIATATTQQILLKSDNKQMIGLIQ